MTDKEVIKQAAESLAVIVAWWNGLPYAQGGEKHQTHTAAEAALDNCLKALAEQGSQPVVTYEQVMATMLNLRTGTAAEQQMYEVLRDKPLYTASQPQPLSVPQGWNKLTDEDRKAAFESMPDMLEGFLKTWGWLHFAKEIEERCKQKNMLAAAPEAPAQEAK